MISNAKKIFDQIENLDYIKTHMIGKEFENTWFDCKQKARADRGNIDDNDKKLFAKAISGFANTSGGVLIFGLDARENRESIDIIQEIKPIKDITLFISDLHEHETRIVERAVSGLEYKKIFTDQPNDEGIVVIYIPEGQNPPYRSIKDSKFYIRAGDAFASIDLPQIESLVLRNLKPNLEISISYKLLGNSILDMAFQITNIGRAMAKYSLLELRFPRGLEVFCNMGSIPEYVRIGDLYPECIVYNYSYRDFIHPNRTIKLPNFILDFNAKPPVLLECLQFELLLYAENMPQKVHEIKLANTKLRLALATRSVHQVIKDFELKQIMR